MFIGFANFYRRFIHGFSRIAAPLTSMLKPSRNKVPSILQTLEIEALPRKDDNIVGNGGGDVGGSETARRSGGTDVGNLASRSSFLTPKTKIAFAQLRKAFTEAPILHHFEPDRYIWIKTDAFGYAIGGVLSQRTPETGQWNPVTYFSRKMIPAETRYETQDGELLAIVEAFKTWRHYLEGCKHEVLVLTDHNNL